MLACGVKDIVAAQSLVRNLFLSSFSRHLKVTRKDIKDTFKTVEKRTENDVAVEPHTKTVVLAFHHWAKMCHWLDIDPGLTRTKSLKRHMRSMNSSSFKTPLMPRQPPSLDCLPRTTNGMTVPNPLKDA